MIRITTDRAIGEKLSKIREREFEKRLIYERIERLEESLRKLECEIDMLKRGIETCKTNKKVESKACDRLERGKMMYEEAKKHCEEVL